MTRRLLTVALALVALLLVPSAALAKQGDRNHDRIPDRWERHFHLSLKQNEAKRDADHDGLNNKQEFRDHTNPRDADTDNDGVEDGQEVETANNPRDADTDNNGVEDGAENTGTITSFDSGTGTLVIDLGNGQSVTGQVTSATRIECRTRQEQEAENENENEATSADHGSDGSGDSGGGDNSGPGSTSSGPGDGEQQNDGTTCGMSDLQPGTAVHEAELEGQTFDKVELIK